MSLTFPQKLEGLGVATALLDVFYTGCALAPEDSCSIHD
jgi:hypothetical protein